MHRLKRRMRQGLEILGLDRFDPSGPVVMAQIKTRPLMQAQITRAWHPHGVAEFDHPGRWRGGGTARDWRPRRRPSTHDRARQSQKSVAG
ncbi:MAG: hypothetical protein HOQ37_12880 [Cupriavidus sp.]|nr:hypothetical protein [Cupriavidus sp.]